ncbi:unnamed protein product, partial [Didymodactylos carnosus]
MEHERSFQKQPTIFLNKKNQTLKGKAKAARYTKNVGLGFKTPREAIEGSYIDKKCPFTGNVSIRGRILTGIVLKMKMQRTIVIRRDYLHYVRKYNRFEKRHKNMSVHLSPCFRDVSIGDVVTIGECRPLSKTVRFNVLKVAKASVEITNWKDLIKYTELLCNDKKKEVKIYMIDEEDEQIHLSSETEFNENVMYARDRNVDILKLIVYIGNDRIFDGMYKVPLQNKQIVQIKTLPNELEYRTSMLDINRDVEKFPKNKLKELMEKVLSDKWYIPCKVDESLGVCLVAATKLTHEGLANLNEDCKSFIDIIVPDAFRKLQNTPSVNGWPDDIQFGIFEILELFIDLVCTQLRCPLVPVGLLNILALTFDCTTTYQQQHKTKQYINRNYNLNGYQFVKMQMADDRLSYGWLRSLIDRFVMQNGIENMKKLFALDDLKAGDYNALLKVFANCKDCIIMERYQILFSEHIFQAIDYVKRSTEDVNDLIETLHVICVNYMLPTGVNELKPLIKPKRLKTLTNHFNNSRSKKSNDYYKSLAEDIRDLSLDSERKNSKKQRTDEDLLVQKPVLFDSMPPSIDDEEKNNSVAEDTFATEELIVGHHHHGTSPSLKRKHKRQNVDKQQHQNRRNTVAVITTTPAPSKPKDHEKKKDRRQTLSTLKHSSVVLEKYDRSNPEDIIRFFASMKLKIADLYDHLETATFNGRIKDVLKTEEKIKLLKPYSARFVTDENIPDGSHVKPNEVFRKCWILLNDGSLPWDDTDVKLTNLSDSIKVVNEPHVPVTAPHSRAHIYVDFIAPNDTGVFESKWILSYRHYTFGPMIWCSIRVVDDTVIIPNYEIGRNDNIMMESTGTITLSSASSNNNYVTVLPSSFSHRDSCCSVSTISNSFDIMDIPLPTCFDLTKPFKPKEMPMLTNDNYGNNHSNRTSITYSRLSSVSSSINDDDQDLFCADFLDEAPSDKRCKPREVKSYALVKNVENRANTVEVQQTQQEQESATVPLPLKNNRIEILYDDINHKLTWIF